MPWSTGTPSSSGTSMPRRKAADVRADRVVDHEHHAASRQKDPVAYLRARQAAAEAAFAVSGHPDELALVRAFERSLDGVEKS